MARLAELTIQELFVYCFTFTLVFFLFSVDGVSLLSAADRGRHLTRERVVNNSDNLKNDKYLNFILQIYQIDVR